VQVNGLVQNFTTTELQLTYTPAFLSVRLGNVWLLPVEILLHIISLSANLFFTQFENKSNFKIVEF
jgi:hypothetical protein